MQRRLDFLDFLRFVAAFSVLLQHGGEKLFPWFRDFSTNYFQFGVFGVTLFFLCSGFIIPVSLEKNGSLKKFWISRIFRLFPLYYASIISTLIFIYFGFMDASFPSIKTIFWNSTMLMRFVGQPSILGSYWTLSLEMLFYFLVSLLFLFKILNKTVVLSITALCLCLIFGVFATTMFHLFTKGWGTMFYLATMFTGTVFYKNHKSEVSNNTLRAVLLFAIFTLITNTYSNLYGRPNIPELVGSLSFIPVTSALLAGYVLFYLCFSIRNINYHPVFLKMGVISYSLYLVQGAIYTTVPAITNQPVLSLIMWLALIIAVSFITYNFIEKPFLNLGNSLKNNVKRYEEVKVTS
ncbi:acyltransferase [Dyadobacter sp. LHD-138]|uniref:acyltransferase family protein n=1 Tax=Dyadobacter sp. LHD-138 TaxID=3071413 RepID=UPI0027DFAF8E|nr:acyltransferase [Dyadobacter sp. LHD-138]MDQ6481563.1 acyltransferase [Dyadobacter sp. LHD-138]